VEWVELWAILKVVEIVCGVVIVAVIFAVLLLNTVFTSIKKWRRRNGGR
jgi:hypothetical protein